MAGNARNRNSLASTDVIKVKVLGNKVIPVANKRIVGYCQNILHSGMLTRKLMEEHATVWESSAAIFVKYENAADISGTKEKAAGAVAASEDKTPFRKQQEAAEAEELEIRGVLFSRMRMKPIIRCR